MYHTYIYIYVCPSPQISRSPLPGGPTSGKNNETKKLTKSNSTQFMRKSLDSWACRGASQEGFYPTDRTNQQFIHPMTLILYTAQHSTQPPHNHRGGHWQPGHVYTYRPGHIRSSPTTLCYIIKKQSSSGSPKWLRKLGTVSSCLNEIQTEKKK